MKSTTPRWVWLALWAAAAASFALKFWLILGRRFPYNDDELIYLVESVTMAAFGSFESAFPAFDAPTRYAPLYAFLLSPCTILATDPIWGYRLALLLNALFTSSIVFPAFFLLRRFIGWRAVLPAAVLAFWSTPFMETLVAMSEAPFHPLFLWAALAYVRVAEKTTAGRSLVLSIALVSLVLTRNAGVVVLPATTSALFLDIILRSHGATVGRRLSVAILVAVGVTVLPWASFFGWRELLQSAVRGQTIGRYAGIGLAAVTSVEGLWYLGVAIWGQLMCLVAGSLGLGAVVTCAFGQRLLMNIRERVCMPSAMWSQLFFFGFAGAGLFTASVIHMHSGLLRTPNVDKYNMYGRYVEMLIPPLVMYGVAYVMTFRAEPLRRRAWVLGSALVLTAIAFAYALKTRSGKSVLWLNVMDNTWESQTFLFVGIVALFLVVFSPLRTRWRVPAIVLLLLVPQAVGVRAFQDHLLAREGAHYGNRMRVYELVDHVRATHADLQENDGVIWMRSIDRRQRVARLHFYLFQQELRPCRSFPEDMGPNDYYYWENRFYPAPFSRERHQNDP
jgi:hypothetical protein